MNLSEWAMVNADNCQSEMKELKSQVRIMANELAVNGYRMSTKDMLSLVRDMEEKLIKAQIIRNSIAQYVQTQALIEENSK